MLWLQKLLCWASRLLMMLSIILISLLTAHKLPLDTSLHRSFKECILVCILCFWQNFPCNTLKNHEDLLSCFTSPGVSEEEKMLPYYAKCPVNKEENVQDRLTQSGQSDIRFSNPDRRSHSISLWAWSRRKDLRQEVRRRENTTVRITELADTI